MKATEVRDERETVQLDDDCDFTFQTITVELQVIASAITATPRVSAATISVPN